MMVSNIWFPTYSGKRIDLMDLDASQINMVDIAHSLSIVPRYNGHTTVPLSVAEHCVRLSWLVPERVAGLALLHDLAEYVMGDMPRPIKALLPEYGKLEDRLLTAGLKKFGQYEFMNTPEAASMWEMDKVFPLVEAMAGLVRYPDNMPPMNGERTKEFIEYLYTRSTLQDNVWGWPSAMAEHFFLIRAETLHIKAMEP